ncbi:hypothetical protein LAV35_18380 [Clostridium sporogenes]|uniref:hypothetical protein n=1 Tax=Clostridium sporogenes TaxID=1509 RepID=UPI0013C82E0C|nr:hypothetical protein [Clostridium sporogenes]MCW6062626.1 hypothetical protein [Clostridium sporogenes]MCW6070121.1 hypothetical protein [Clostridium sporogenes]NFQ01079.1 hypothetical protein [Clostridium sporogenes]NFQ42960.1 hypothetical protein [Clostridium sporogenes]
MFIFLKTNKYLIALIKINKYTIIVLVKTNKKERQNNGLLKILIIMLYLLLILLFCLKIINFVQLSTIILTIIATFRK